MYRPLTPACLSAHTLSTPVTMRGLRASSSGHSPSWARSTLQYGGSLAQGHCCSIPPTLSGDTHFLTSPSFQKEASFDQNALYSTASHLPIPVQQNSSGKPPVPMPVFPRFFAPTLSRTHFNQVYLHQLPRNAPLRPEINCMVMNPMVSVVISFMHQLD